MQRIVSFLLLTAACSSTPPAAGPQSESPPAVPTFDKPDTSAPEVEISWQDQTPKDVSGGVVDFVRLDSGKVVGVQSYANDARPFAYFHQKDDKWALERAPWTCGGGPAEIEASGDHAWVHCMQKTASPMVGFWRGSFAAAAPRWDKVGLLIGAIALGQYAVAGDKLFVLGSMKVSDKSVVVMRKAVPQWLAKNRSVAASADGSQLAIVAVDGTDIVIARSSDNGETFEELARKASDGHQPKPASARIHNGKLSVVLENDSARATGILIVGLDKGEVAVNAFPKDAEAACAHGLDVAVRFSPGEVSLSRGGGVTLTAVPAPPSVDGPLPGTLRCNARGVRSGGHFAAWPSD